MFIPGFVLVMFDAQSYMFFPVGGSCMGNGVSAVIVLSAYAQIISPKGMSEGSGHVSELKQTLRQRLGFRLVVPT